MIRAFIPITVGSAVGFQCFNSALDFGFVPPPPGKYAGTDRHRWRNASTSLFNSTILAAITAYCFIYHPELLKNPMGYYSIQADVCAAIVSGYLIYDMCDLVAHSNFIKVWSLVVHHVISNFVFIVLSLEQVAMGIMLIGLLCEFSAIFLHSRQLLLMYGFSKRSLVYGVHKVFNLVFFVLLRLAPIMYGCYASFISSHLPAYMAVSLPPLIAMLVVTNFILLWRLFCSDFLENIGRGNHIMDN